MFRQILQYLMSSWTYCNRPDTRPTKGAEVLLSQCRLPRFYSPRGRGHQSASYALAKFRSRSLNLLSNFSTMRLRLWDSLITTLRPSTKSGERTGRSFYSTVLEHLQSIRLKVSKVLTAFGLKRLRLYLHIRLKYLSLLYGKKDQKSGSHGTQETQPTQLTSYSTVRSPHLIRYTRKSVGKTTLGSPKY